jgi:serine/threonine protein kinase
MQGIGLEDLEEEEFAQLMREVDLVKQLSHPGIVPECVVPLPPFIFLGPLLRLPFSTLARADCCAARVHLQIRREWCSRTDSGIRKIERELRREPRVQDFQGTRLPAPERRVHCELKAANILTTKTGNVKPPDFGISLNRRAMEREIKDVVGTPNWMAPEVIALQGASTKSDMWLLEYTIIIEPVTGRLPNRDIGNTMTGG